MMPCMSGNLKQITGVFAVVLLGMVQTANACPACSLSNNQNSPLQTFLAFAVMGVLPLVLALWVGLKIRKILNNEQRSKI